jgi:hypothetical protein
MNMLTWCFIFVIILFTGCSYTQPAITEPHGIVQALGELRILKINDERVINLGTTYVFRVAPGQHTFLLERGHNKHVPAKGTNSPYATFPLEIKEGMHYYLDVGLEFDSNELLFGIDLKNVKSWYPILKKEISAEEVKEIKSQKYRKLPTPKLRNKTIEEQQKKIEEQQRIIDEQLKKIEEQQRLLDQQK